MFCYLQRLLGCIVIFHISFFGGLLKPKHILPISQHVLKNLFSNVLQAFNKPSMTPES